MKMIEVFEWTTCAWTWYERSGYVPNYDARSGKWMYFFNHANMDKVPVICETAVSRGVVELVKHTLLEHVYMDNHGVCCFYANADDIDAHKRIIQFFFWITD